MTGFASGWTEDGVAGKSARAIWAVVPAKPFSCAKERLSGRYSPAFRAGLARAMLGDVLACLSRVPALAGILVVTADEEAARLAEAVGAGVLADPGAGYSAAINAAARHLAGQGHEGMLAIPGDVPLISEREIVDLLTGHSQGRGVSLVPDRDRQGTNALLVTPPDGLAASFGPDSFRRHVAMARAAGMEPVVQAFPGLGLDIDEPQDLDLFLRAPASTRTHDFLVEQGLLSVPRDPAETPSAA